MKKQQTGFTLVEIAIVLVIIGLMLGGVLKGQELINSAKAKNLANDFRTTSTLVYGYQDRFKSFPGDQTAGQLEIAFGTGKAAACTSGEATCSSNNGRIDGEWNAPDVKSETFTFWQHVRLANLATGSTNVADANYLPLNADGGHIGIESGVNSSGAANPPIKEMRGSYYVCSNNILGRYAKQIDSIMDDGNTATGSVRAVPAGSARTVDATATASMVDGVQYLVCAAY